MRKHVYASTFDRFILLVTVRAGRVARFIDEHKIKIQLIAGVIALSLGFWGWMIEKPATDLWGVLDNAFRTAQLISLQFPTLSSAPSIPLQIARFALPLVAILASFQVLIASVTRPARLALLPRISDHIVVCGFAGMTEKALWALAERGRQVVVVIPGISSQYRYTLEGIGLTVVDADPLSINTLKFLNLSRAAAVFLLCRDDLDNLNIAMLAIATLNMQRADLPPLVLALKIDREDLAVELDGALDGLSRRYGVYYHRLSPNRENVRLELSRFAPAFSRQDLNAPSHVLMVGLAGDWRQVLSLIIATVQDHPDNRPVITFAVDRREGHELDRWRKSRPQLGLLADIVVLTRDANAALPSDSEVVKWRKVYASPQLVVVLREDADAIATVLALRHPASTFGIQDVPILAHQSKDDRLLPNLSHAAGGNRDLANLRPIGNLVRVETIERILDRKGDEMAAALHASYLASAKTLGAGSQSTMESWNNIPENLRDANRASVDHVPILLSAGGFGLAKQADGQSQTPSEGELEIMAKVEHRRWMAERILAGWRFAPARDDDLKLHPDLVPYEMLTAEAREKDRNTVRALLAAFQRGGFAIVRIRAPI
jgi:hypothetical protein